MALTNGNLLHEKTRRQKGAHSAKECAFLAVFAAIVVAVQTVFSALPGVELVTVLFVSYSFVMGPKRGTLSAVAFALLRQAVFGIDPKVLVLYLLYFPFLTFVFGSLGRRIKHPVKALVLIVATACVCTVIFNLTDNVLTPLWLGYNARDAKLYFMASLPFMLPQLVSTAVSVQFLFLPLCKVFRAVGKP